MIRPEIVAHLVQHLLTDVRNRLQEDVTADEVYSAVLTLSWHMLKVAKSMDVQMEVFRPGVILLYEELGPTPTATLH